MVVVSVTRVSSVNGCCFSYSGIISKWWLLQLLGYHQKMVVVSVTRVLSVNGGCFSYSGIISKWWLFQLLGYYQ